MGTELNPIENQESSSKAGHIEELKELIEFKKYLKTNNKQAYNLFTKLKVNSTIECLESTLNMYSKIQQAKHLDDE